MPSLRLPVAVAGLPLRAGVAASVLETFPFGGMIASASMLFATVDDPLVSTPPRAPYAASCEGGDGFLIEREGKLFVL